MKENHCAHGAMLACMCMLSTVVQAVPKQPLTAADALETTRFAVDQGLISPSNPEGAVAISPDGKRYVFRMVQGDVARNGAWMNVVSGRIDSAGIVQAPVSVARLFTSGLGAGIGNFGPNRDVSDIYYGLRWMDDTHIALLWSDEQGSRQVVRIDLTTGLKETLTRHPTSVDTFDIAPNNAVLYSARARASKTPAEVFTEGYIVPDGVDAHGLITRNLTGSVYDTAWNTEWFVQDAGTNEPHPLRIGGRKVELMYGHPVHFSPDGRYALITSAPLEYPQSWDGYKGLFQMHMTALRRDARQPMARLLKQWFVVDVAQRTARPLWNALAGISDVKWSPDGRSVLVAPTYLPVESGDATGLEGNTVAIVDVASGKYRTAPLDLKGAWVVSMQWSGDDAVEIRSRRGETIEVARLRRTNDEWASTGLEKAAETQQPVRFELRQDLDTPPKLFAVSGKEVLLMDSNPQLRSRFTLGKVEKLTGTLPSGDTWAGLLFYPVHYKAGRRYPLVIQSVYGTRMGAGFTLYGYAESGMGLGPTLIASYPGQVLANRDIAVLHVDYVKGPKASTPQEGEGRKMLFEAAIERAVDLGVADREKVGLVGFSRNGWYVEYTLTHSEFPFAAAISADNWDPSYFQSTLSGDFTSSAAVNGGAPFGEGLKAWLEKSPGFNADKVRAPLRMVEQSTGGVFGVFAKWEMYSRLKHLNKPVEFQVMPDAEEHGAHNTQNPKQILAVQQGSVDWFDFWLNGREEGGAKAEQFARWHKLRTLRDAALKPAGN